MQAQRASMFSGVFENMVSKHCKTAQKNKAEAVGKKYKTDIGFQHFNNIN
jgi:hypothetical protein